MILRGTKLLLFFLFVISVALIISPTVAADSWVTQQSDSQSVTDITMIAWNIEQNDSHTVSGILALSWYTQQNDSSPVTNILSASASWKNQQNDSANLALTNPGWRSQQNDGTGLSMSNPGYRTQQSGSEAIIAPDSIWYEQQTCLSNEIEVTVQKIPSFILSFGSGGAVIIGLMFIAIIIIAIVGRIR